MIFNPNDYTIVFLSYDEPNADENYQHLLTIRPDALRIHGIKGSDTAHKECAKLSITNRITIVDADNYIKSSFNDPIELMDSFDLNNTVLSYSGLNSINGNSYGNGGIKNWPVNLILNMHTHENGNENSIDFNYQNYYQLNTQGSEVRINASPQQAWRSGFREGIKLSLDKNIDWRNYDRLWRWMHVGADLINGLWAIHGARSAFYLSRIKQWKCPEGVRDFDFLNIMFNGFSNLSQEQLLIECNQLGTSISLIDKHIKNVLSIENSKQYRETIAPILRSNTNEPFDIVFISYNESYADDNYNKLLGRFPNAKRINGIKGIHQAHIMAAKLCTTDYFWVVDADAEIVPTFNFNCSFPFYEQPKVRVWRSKNAVNDLVYGNGGVKLLPRTQVLLINSNTVDMTSSIGTYEPVFELSNINNFNTDEFSTWRSAFRECAKLASQVINNQVSDETTQRLLVWCTHGKNKPFGEFAIKGAIAGKLFGEKYKDNLPMLQKINNYDWLNKKFS